MKLEKRKEYTNNHGETHGIYSHTEDGKRFYHIEFNQGYNECLKDLKEVASVERINKIMYETDLNMGWSSTITEEEKEFFFVLAQAISKMILGNDEK